MPFSFKINQKSSSGQARTGTITTTHGEIQTPAFMPVGTQATVKGMTTDELKQLGCELIVCNTYHLMLRPGETVVAEHGGLHGFMNWDRPILTDSGGFQAFSLTKIRKLEEGGIRFQSHIDGSEHLLSPQRAIEIQWALGSDIMMVLDECTPYPVTVEQARESMELSIKWEEQSLAHFNDLNCAGPVPSESSLGTSQKAASVPTRGSFGPPAVKNNRALFAIVQGSIYPELRQECLERLLAISEQSSAGGFAGYALGGLAIGEPLEETYQVIDTVVPQLPTERPRYLMGLGTVEDLVRGVAAGSDLFDCVIPTRTARNGRLITQYGDINILNARFAEDQRPLDPDCPCATCRGYSRAYLRHLFMAKEILAARLATGHNLYTYLDLMRQMRKAIAADRFNDFEKDFYEKRQCGL